MNNESRVKKTILNARVNLIFYFLTLALSFFSRKIFLTTLGDNFIGLTGTLSNLLSFLNLAELGIGTAIGYVLYKPLYEHEHDKINDIISVLGYLYRWVGIIILISGFILSLFLPLIFPNTGFNLSVIYCAYYSFLCSTLISYFINYRQVLLGADQKNYVVTAYFQTAIIIKTLIQMAAAYYVGSYYVWITIELIFGIIYSFILNWKINQVYPWLKSEVRCGKKMRKKYPEILKYTKQIFIHKLGGLVQLQLTPFLVYAFVSLQTVTLYGNYTLIVDKLTILLRNFLDSTAAGVGNLIAENNKNKALKIYWELMTIRIFFISVIAFLLYTLLPTFIELWLGKEYILSESVLLSVIIIFALNIMRGVNDQFLQAHGLFNDIWAPIIESVIFIIVALIGGYYWKLEGLLWASIVSLFLVHYIWKPFYLFSKGFRISTLIYWKYFTLNIFLIIVSLLSFRFIDIYIPINISAENWFTFITYSIYSGILYTILLFTLLYLGTEGMKNVVYRIIKKRI